MRNAKANDSDSFKSDQTSSLDSHESQRNRKHKKKSKKRSESTLKG